MEALKSKEGNKEFAAIASKRAILSNSEKWWVSIIAGVVFAVVSSPWLYSITNQIFSGALSNGGGPTLQGLLLHTIVFILIIRLFMW